MNTQLIVSKSDNINNNIFSKVKGNLGNNKPKLGGFWTSTKTEEGNSGWLEFAMNNDFYEDTSSLFIHEAKVSPNAKVLIINSKEDYELALKTFGKQANSIENPLCSPLTKNNMILDLEKISQVYHGLSLTKNGMIENYQEFYGWDCESTVWFTLDCLENFKSYSFETVDIGWKIYYNNSIVYMN